MVAQQCKVRAEKVQAGMVQADKATMQAAGHKGWQAWHVHNGKMVCVCVCVMG